jgi:hypothetical protein
MQPGPDDETLPTDVIISGKKCSLQSRKICSAETGMNFSVHTGTKKIAAMRAPRIRALAGDGGAMGFYTLHFSGL